VVIILDPTLSPVCSCWLAALRLRVLRKRNPAITARITMKISELLLLFFAAAANSRAEVTR
jgi:hypothetical protein